MKVQAGIVRESDALGLRVWFYSKRMGSEGF